MRFQLHAAAAAFILLSGAALAQTPPKLLHKVTPEYPAEARAAHISGLVRMEASMNANGSVRDVKATSGHPLLAAAAVAAVRQWEYEPLVLNGQPADYKASIDLNFALPAEGPEPVQVTGNTQQQKLIRQVTPVYPAEARQQGIAGGVWMKAVIDPDGNVQSLEVEDGAPSLVAAAVDAVKQWKYAPTVVDGAPVAVTTAIHINFTLSPE